MDHDLEGVADPLRVGVKRVVDLVEFEMVSDDRIGQDLAFAHELERAPAVHPALSARRVDADVRTHGEIHVDLDRARVPGDDADASPTPDVLERLLHRARPAGALENAVGAPAAGDLPHTIAEVLVANVDGMVGAQLLADRQPRVAGAGEDDPGGAEGLAELDGDEP